MRPQFFPWLFDDKNAWEKVFADPRYSYEMPIDYFMAIYQVERKYDSDASTQYALPELSTPMSLPAAAATAFAPSPVPAFLTATAAAPAAAAPKQESKHEEGILSQEEIDALLSGI
ncbi:MAG: hypothetical protein LBC75_04670 [Fibromonadaceae bacterium]|jgi:hypothetical protein|nr:hypothetical protein [Fibromonadaceae bacterium]